MIDTPTPAQFVAHMVTEFSLPAALGDLQTGTPSPIEGVPVPGDQRIKFGFEFPGTSFMFPLSKGVGVFLDMSGNRTQWWFDHPSAKGACDLVDRTVRGKHSGFKQLADEKRKEPNMRRRVLEAELQPQRFAQIEMSYPEPNANSGLFVVQVFGLQRVGDKFYATRLPAMIPDIQGLN